MKKSVRKLLIIILALIVLVPSFSLTARAEEQEDEGSYTVEALFDINTTKTLGRWNFEYNDKWFCQSASIYNHKLARLSLGMAVSSFRPNLDPDAMENPADHLHKFLEGCQFTGLRTDDYDKNPSLYTVSTVMRHKYLTDDQGDFVLIAVGVCGGGYSNEWMSNFTCGDGMDHLGFSSAAEEVFDRLFGYIAATNLAKERIKIWVAGFSRAAAVSNIFAAKLVDTELFDNDNVFAYTFATPRTTKKPNNGEYPNIFNICGKMDPVTQVAFADWGFNRYGITLYTPSQETDSEYNQMAARANKVHSEHFGLDFFNNVEWDTRLRLFLNYLLKIAPTSAVYSKHMQTAFVRMWEKKTPSNIMTNLMELAGNKELINDNNQKEANSMLTYLAYTISGLASKSSVTAKYRNDDATLVGNLAREHTPEVYLSWLFSTDDPKALFTDYIKYTRLVIDGNVDVSVFQLEPEYEFVKSLKADGSFAEEIEYGGMIYYRKANVPDIFMERVNGERIILLPKDRPYTILVTSNEKQKVEMHAIPLKVGYTDNEFSQLHYAEMDAGEYDVLYSPSEELETIQSSSAIIAGSTFDVVKISSPDTSELAISLENANILNLSWRQIVVIIYCIPIVVICLGGLLITWAVGGHKVRRKKRLGLISDDVIYNKKPAACIFGSIAMFMLQELLYWLMPQFMMTRSMIKLVIGLFLLYICYKGYTRQPSMLSRDIFIALSICMFGDMTINFSFIGGMLMFGAAEAVLAYRFSNYDKPDRWQWIVWALSIVLCVFVISTVKSLNANTLYRMAAYSVILTAALVTSLTMPKKIRFGAIFLAVSNILLFVHEVYRKTLLIHILSLGIYYLAFGCFAFATRYKEQLVIKKTDKTDSSLDEKVPVENAKTA
ncbi:MAG: hypothetical protein IJG59_09500 [Erysipelotrichaceae bacterium]|nr:hypothetical protein [Erysipelotrichaceae bacterium]